MARVQIFRGGRPRPRTARSAGAADSVPLLPEIMLALSRLKTSGEETILDLREAPLGPEDERRLFDALKNEALVCRPHHCGSCRIHETDAPCVWIVEHLNPGGDVTAKFIEVSFCPGALERGSPDFDDELLPGLVNRRPSGLRPA